MIFGLDQSLTASGLIVLDLKGKLVYRETIKPKLKAELRLLEIREKLDFLTQKYEPQLIVMEGLAYGIHAGMIADLGGLFWMLKLRFFETNIPVKVVAPTTLKKWVLGVGKGQKSEMMRGAMSKWPETAAFNEHEVDAYGLAQIGLALQGNGKGLAKYEREVLDVISKQGGIAA